jgi:hypothetical protein
MLTSKEVAAMIKSDVAKLLHARIDELENAIVNLLRDYEADAALCNHYKIKTNYTNSALSAKLLLEKGISV